MWTGKKKNKESSEKSEVGAKGNCNKVRSSPSSTSTSKEICLPNVQVASWGARCLTPSFDLASEVRDARIKKSRMSEPKKESTKRISTRLSLLDEAVNYPISPFKALLPLESLASPSAAISCLTFCSFSATISSATLSISLRALAMFRLRATRARSPRTGKAFWTAGAVNHLCIQTDGWKDRTAEAMASLSLLPFLEPESKEL